MAVRDILHQLEVQSVASATILSDSTVFGTSVNTANFDNGYMITASALAYADGTYVITLQDSPDNSVWTDIPAEKLLFPPGGSGNITITAITSVPELIGRLGAFSTEKFVRPKIVASSVTSGAIVEILMTKKPENRPI